MTTYPISMPTTPQPNKSTFGGENAVAITESPFTFEQQAFLHPGQRWKADISLPPMDRLQAEPWNSFFGLLNGRFGTFLMGDPDAIALGPMGIATGSPKVSGAAQTGQTLITTGWTANKNGILLAGDYIQLGSGATARLYKNLAKVNSGAGGSATLIIWPALRSSPANNAAIVVNNPMTQFRLDADIKWDSNEVSTYGVKFSATEAL